MIKRKKPLNLLWAGVIFSTACVNKIAPPEVSTLPLPEGYIQPKIAVSPHGTVHLICYKGDPANGDIYYGTISPEGESFSSFIQVNNIPGTAIAAGTIRGAQLAVGKDETVHVLWNGSGKSTIQQDDSTRVTPLLYTRKRADEKEFEPSRNIITKAWGLDGGSALTADEEGNVYIAWHAPVPGSKGEKFRRVWLASSRDMGQTFEEEKIVSDTTHGVCGCCGLQIHTQDENIYVLYRNVKDTTSRDMQLVSLSKKGTVMNERTLDEWPINGCPMSSAAIASGSTGTFGAWETGGLIRYCMLGNQLKTTVLSPQSQEDGSRHPSMAIGDDHYTLLTWSEGTGWNRGGGVAWEITHPDNKLSRSGKMRESVPVWSFPSGFFVPEKGFTIVY